MTYSPTAGINTSSEPARIPGRDCGKRDAQEGAQRAGAEIRSRLEQRQVVLFEIRVQRQDHERQVRIHDADVYREVGLHAVPAGA